MNRKDLERDTLQGRKHTQGDVNYEDKAFPGIQKGWRVIPVNDSSLSKIGRKIKGRKKAMDIKNAKYRDAEQN